MRYAFECRDISQSVANRAGLRANDRGMCLCACVRARMSMCMCMCVNVDVHVYVHVYVCMCVCVRLCVLASRQYLG